VTCFSSIRRCWITGDLWLRCDVLHAQCYWLYLNTPNLFALGFWKLAIQKLENRFSMLAFKHLLWHLVFANVPVIGSRFAKFFFILSHNLSGFDFGLVMQFTSTLTALKALLVSVWFSTFCSVSFCQYKSWLRYARNNTASIEKVSCCHGLRLKHLV